MKALKIIPTSSSTAKVSRENAKNLASVPRTTVDANIYILLRGLE